MLSIRDSDLRGVRGFSAGRYGLIVYLDDPIEVFSSRDSYVHSGETPYFANTSAAVNSVVSLAKW